MVTEQLPAPWLDGRWRAIETEDVAPFAQHCRPADEVAEKTIEPHHVARDLVALRAHAHAQHAHDSLAHLIGGLIEAQTVSLDVVLSVLPLLPDVRIERKAHALALGTSYTLD